MNAGHQDAAGVLGEIEHDVAQEDHVEAVLKRQRLAEIGLPEGAHLADLVFGDPVVADVVEVAKDVPCGQTAVDLDAVVGAAAGALDHFAGDVGALDAESPADDRGEVLAAQQRMAME